MYINTIFILLKEIEAQQIMFFKYFFKRLFLINFTQFFIYFL